jgi:hypothetical protein
MGDLSSINFKKSFAINVQHNDRTLPPSYLIGNDKEVNRSAAEALALKQEMINRAFEKYTARTGQKPQAKNYEWSAVVNLKPSSTMQDLENLAQHLQDKYGLQCYQLAIHRDEGHINEKGEKVINHHAHIELITLDRETGVNNFKRSMITRQVLRDMQSEVAEILGMQRGIDKRTSKVKRIEPRIYAKMKEQEKNVKIKHEHELSEVKFKANQDILKYKESKDDEIIGLQTALQNEKTAHAVTKQEIKARIEQERKAWIKEQGHTKEQYAELRELANSQYNTIAELENRIQELNDTIKDLKQENYEKEMKQGRQEFNDIINSYSQNAKDTPKIENNPIKVKMKGQIYEINLSQQTKDQMATFYLNERISTIEKNLNNFEVKLPDAKKRSLDIVGKVLNELSIFKEKIVDNLVDNLKEIFKLEKYFTFSKNKGNTL